MAFTSLLDKVVHCIASLSPGGAHGHSHGPDNLSRPHRDSELTHTHPSVPERPPCCRNVTDELRTELASAHKHSPSMDHLGASFYLTHFRASFRVSLGSGQWASTHHPGRRS